MSKSGDGESLNWWDRRQAAAEATELPVIGREGLPWRQSSFAGPGAVEVARLSDGVAIRHSAARDGAALLFDPIEFQALADGIRLGEFDNLTPALGVDGYRPAKART